MKLKVKDLSVVIATLGGISLRKALIALNSGSVIPQEIIICIPKDVSVQLEDMNYKNIKIIRTSKRGQVIQRLEGLLQAKSPIVIQMDDDVFIEKKTIEELLFILNIYGRGHALSPVFCDANSTELLTKYKKGFKGIIRNLIDFTFFGSYWGILKMGTISYSGTPFYYDFNLLDKDLMLSTWLPGGMVICHKEDLILEDYYPFEGKAYYEDVIHSILWRNKGIKLMVANIIVPTLVNKEKTTLNELINEYHAKKYLISLLNYGNLYYYLSFFFSLIMNFIKKLNLKKLFKN